MYNHAPVGYQCPFCAVARGQTVAYALTTPADVVFRNEAVTAFIASHWWPNNPGHLLIIPNAHYENIYDLPDDVGAEVVKATRYIAIALKQIYGCDGVSTRQHNEPAGNQDVWHYHLHLFPRHARDDLYLRTPERYPTTPEDREPYATKLRAAMGSIGL